VQIPVDCGGDKAEVKQPLGEVYVARDWSEMCISLGRKAYCAQNGAVRETKLELVFSRLELYEGEMREVYRPKGRPAFTTAAREHVRILQPPRPRV